MEINDLVSNVRKKVNVDTCTVYGYTFTSNKDNNNDNANYSGGLPSIQTRDSSGGDITMAAQ